MTLHPIAVVDQVIEEYRGYLATEFRASDEKLRSDLAAALDAPDFLAQEPFFQAHRPFKEGLPWQELGIDPRLAKVMEKRSHSPRAYLHQSEAIRHLMSEQARALDVVASPASRTTSYPERSEGLAVTTGTGSGKTECFLLPVIQNAIDDSVAHNQGGLTAILVYPMNALANDQEERINEYLQASGHTHVRVARYDRSTKEDERQQLRDKPPHILLTNYMMLEYLMVRPADREALFANHRCRFVVLDEVHTYRGGLGANIALLYRRLVTHLRHARQDWKADNRADKRRFPELLTVATSATIKSVDEAGKSAAQVRALRDSAVQDFLAKLTGIEGTRIKVLGEEIKELEAPTGGGLLWKLHELLAKRPLAISQMVERVMTAAPPGQAPDAETLRREIVETLVAGSEMADGTPGALRLRTHRIIRGGWEFTRCVDPACGRLHPMGEEKCTCGKTAAPLYLCRSCGADTLRFKGDEQDPTGEPLQPNAERGGDGEWVLYDRGRLEDETDEEGDEEALVDTEKQMRRRPVLMGSFDPATCMFSSDESAYPMRVALAPARNRCLVCGSMAGARDVITRVALGTSAAVRVLAEGLVEGLAIQNKGQPDHDGKERLLIFSDSRQDAAHQARFITYAGRYDRMRRRLIGFLMGRPEHKATITEVITGLVTAGVRHNDNPQIQGKLDARYLSSAEQARAKAWEEAPLLDDLAITAGYRASVFNLGLVGVRYEQLSHWVTNHGGPLAASLGVSTAQLEHLCRCLLDEIRRAGCLSRPLLMFNPGSPQCPEEFKRAADWERRFPAPSGFACDQEKGTPLANMDRAEEVWGVKLLNAWRRSKAGGRGPKLESVMRRLLRRMGGHEPTADTMVQVLGFLSDSHGPSLLHPVQLHGQRKSMTLLQVNAEGMLLEVLDDTDRYRCSVCNVRLPWAYDGAPCPACPGNLRPWDPDEIERNRYVQRIRRSDTLALVAGEHTAQITGDDRIDLEANFKAPPAQSPLNVLACSPTLEMGIDVGGLDAVVMRNIPPRPDNYAQRGGRAGRRSRVGIVMSYARATPHDGYFFDKPAEMIAGEVPAPGIGMGNRDVILRHLHALAMGACDPGLAGRMAEYISITGEQNQAKVDELIAALQAQFGHAARLALEAWGKELLTPVGLDSEAALVSELSKLPDKVRDLFDRVRLQILKLQETVDRWSKEDKASHYSANHARDLQKKILGIRDSKQEGEADDRGGGHPMRRFAEFGILPGYEFPSEPCTVRLMGDKDEESPVSVARRFGIAQYQPEAIVHARGHRWKVVGLDQASPWNPKSQEPSWLYVRCADCGLRYDQDKPRCPRCQCDRVVGDVLPGYEYGGFLAVRNDTPVLQDEDRFSIAALVACHPQRDGRLKGTWQLPTGWRAELQWEEVVRWVNEWKPPSAADQKQGRPLLHDKGRGFYLCPVCGRTLEIPEESGGKTKGKKKAQKLKGGDPYGHFQDCSRAGQPPVPLAITTSTKATTLRITVVLPSNFGEEEYQGWGYSLGYALRMGIRQLYMLDGPEIEFHLEPMWEHKEGGLKRKLGALTFIDDAIGGSGFLDRAATELHLVARRAIEHLDHPTSNCETACYRCLKSYTNQRHHQHLSWPAILPDLEVLSAAPPEALPVSAHAADDPRPWLAAYDAGVGSPLELKFLRLFEQAGIQVEKQVMVEADLGGPHISQADFRVTGTKTLIYVDGAAFHTGRRLRRDRIIRERLRSGPLGWKVVEVTASMLGDPQAVLAML